MQISIVFSVILVINLLMFIMDWVFADQYRRYVTRTFFVTLVINLIICVVRFWSLYCEQVQLTAHNTTKRISKTGSLTTEEKARLFKVKFMIYRALDQEIGKLEAEQEEGIQREVKIRQVLDMFTLLEETWDVNVTSEYGPPLHVICGYKFLVANPLPIASGLLSEGAALNSLARTPDGLSSTPLYKAVTTQRRDLVQYLVAEKNADIELASSNGWTPLHKAASLQNVAIVGVLIGAGAGVDVKDHEERTPIHLALEGWHTVKCQAAEVVRDLVIASADVESMDISGESCLVKAVASGCDRCVSVLLETRSPLKLYERNCVVEIISDVLPEMPVHLVQLLVEFMIAVCATPLDVERSS